jgi:hypothetical protein
VSAVTVENACHFVGTYRVISTPAGGYDLCDVCFPDIDGVDEIPDDWEVCKPANKSRLHRTERDAGKLKQQQEDYSGYSQPCNVLSKMEVEEFDERIGGGA